MSKRFPLLLMSLLIGCTTIPSGEERIGVADRMAVQHGWHAIKLPTLSFNLIGYVPDRRVSAENILTVYIEGDGLAWLTSSLPSDDPTPKDPVALKLALKHPIGNAAYLARPCQYKKSPKDNCLQKYWMGGRFAPEVISSMSQALDQLKVLLHAKGLNLVGYSGGGAIAALLAARRADVDRLITVAGNLDHRAWTYRHKLTPLDGSLNPPEYIDKLKRVRQWHLAGSNDKVIPVDLIKSFASKFPDKSQPVVIVIPGFDHHCCWVERWAKLWGMVTNN